MNFLYGTLKTPVSPIDSNVSMREGGRRGGGGGEGGGEGGGGGGGDVMERGRDDEKRDGEF